MHLTKVNRVNFSKSRSFRTFFLVFQLQESFSLMQRIDVKVDDPFAAVLKEYCAYWGMTMSELMYEAVKQHIHCSGEVCHLSEQLLKKHGLTADKRAAKPCYGYLCRCCKHQLACRTGLYKNHWEIADEHQHLLKVQSEHSTLQHEKSSSPDV